MSCSYVKTSYNGLNISSLFRASFMQVKTLLQGNTCASSILAPPAASSVQKCNLGMDFWVTVRRTQKTRRHKVVMRKALCLCQVIVAVMFPFSDPVCFKTYLVGLFFSCSILPSLRSVCLLS